MKAPPEADRAWAYIDQIERSVSGQKGHNQLWRTARVLIITFGLSDADTRHLLSRWNAGCMPPWSDQAIEHKIEQVHKNARQAPERREQKTDQQNQSGTKQENPANAQPKASIICFKDIEPKRIEWFWYKRIPFGAVSTLEGLPDLGKSFIVTDLAARCTRGLAMPEDTLSHPPGNVMMLDAEDDPARTLRTRLDMQGANVSNVFLLPHIEDQNGKRLITITRDVGFLETHVVQRNIKFVIINPLAAFLDEEINPHVDAHVRRALFPLRELAERTQVAILCVRHWNKMSNIEDPLLRGSGSIGVIAAARSALFVARHPDIEELRVLARAKGNLSAAPDPLNFRLVVVDNMARLARRLRNRRRRHPEPETKEEGRNRPECRRQRRQQGCRGSQTQRPRP